MSDPFAPLSGGPAATGTAKTKGKGKPAAFVVVSPIPADAPAPPSRHSTLGRPSHRWEYRDAAGRPLGYVCRWDGKGDEKEYRPLSLMRPSQGGAPVWRWEAHPEPRPLYGLDRLAARPGAPVVVAEGEKSANAAAGLLPGHVAVTSPNGSSNGHRADWSPLRGRHIVIWPDNDAPGLDHAETVAEHAWKAGALSVRRLDPPDGVKATWDAANAVEEGWTPERAGALVAAAREVDPPFVAPPRPAPAGGGERPGDPDAPERKRAPAQRDTMMAVAAQCRLWHSPDGEAFATYPVGEHEETRALGSTQFKSWFAYQAFLHLGSIPGAQGIDDVLRIMSAKAVNEGECHAPWTRTGWRDGKLYIDLCDKTWRAVEIDARGWRIRARHGLPFVRSGAMQALPEPERDDACSIDELRPFVNAAEEADFKLVVAWLLGALRDHGPYPVLILNGQQGTGKSVLTRLLRSLVDPNTAPIRAAPKDDQDLLTVAINAHALVIDNMSSVPPWLADALCRLATGGGFATRAHYTNKEENVLQATKPILLNGIPSLVDRPDLGDRAITIRLSPISEEGRLPEDELDAAWNKAQPRILAALCDALSTAVRRLPDVRLTRSPRLADFAKWVTAAEPGLGWEDGAFIEVISANRRDIADTAFEASPIAMTVKDMIDSRRLWSGTATELLTLLGDLAPLAHKTLKSWPQTAQALGNALDRVAPLLKARGVIVERKHSGVRTITITLAEP